MIRSRSTSSRLKLERLEERCVLSVAWEIDLPAVQIDVDEYAQSHLLVQFKPGQTPAALPGTTLAESYGSFDGLYRVELTELTLDQALAEYNADPRVQIAEPDYVITASWTPNDARFADQYHLRNTGQSGGTVGADIKAVQAWSRVVNAQRFPIAVMDSGIDYTHPDLYLNVWINQGEIPASRRVNLVDVDRDGIITFRDLNHPVNIGPGKIMDLNGNGYIDAGDILMPMLKDAFGNDTGMGGWADGISNDGDKYVDDLIGWNPSVNNNNPFDGFGHGTHVSGTIGAVGNNGLGVTGVIWMASLVPIKFLNNNGAGAISWFINGMEYALSKGIRISNNSWNDSGFSQILFNAVQQAQTKGHLFVAAAGNNGRNADVSPAYPANYNLDNVVSVGATDRFDNLASFSNFGANSVHIVAPGVQILSTNPNKSFGVRSGTSMSTPQVTAAMAMVWMLRPEWTHQQVINWVMSSADRVASLNGKVASGRLNLWAAIQVPARNETQPSKIRGGMDGSGGGLSSPGGGTAAAAEVSILTLQSDVAGLLEALERQRQHNR